eukprot:scaffold17879_cov95-Isochrysis_galbana.AAC.1
MEGVAKAAAAKAAAAMAEPAMEAKLRPRGQASQRSRKGRAWRAWRPCTARGARNDFEIFSRSTVVWRWERVQRWGSTELPASAVGVCQGVKS